MSFPAVSRACHAIVLASLLAGAPADAAETPQGWLAGFFNRELRALDARHQQLVAEAATLPESAAVNTSARLGWHSKSLPAPDAAAWAQVDLGRSWPLDFIALVPASGEAQGRQRGPGYGFPVRFRIEAADDAAFSTPTLIHDAGGEDVPNPGALPLVISARGKSARFVRVTSLKAWPRRDDWIVALGELIVLSGPRNVAAGQPVRASSSTQTLPEWSPENFTDGQSVLGPPVNREPSPSNGYLAVHERAPDIVKWVQVDLGSEVPIDEVRLFPARPTDFADAPGSGFPPRFRAEAAGDASFTMPRVLFDSGANDFIPPGENPVTLRGDGKPARFVRVTATRLQDRGGTSTFALAEMQVWSGDRNVALGAAVSALDVFGNPQFPRWQPEFLVDGFTSRHRILDLPGWLRGLARRREILAELSRIESERLAATDATLAFLAKGGAGLIGSVVLLAGGLLWRVRLAKRREVEALRTRIASDLHDEIGSQLGGIALAAQLAARRADDPQKAREHFAEIERIARETNDAMHDIVWLLQPGSANLAELVARLREVTAAQLRGIEFKIECPGEMPARPLTIEFTRHVYLLFKEALANIVKHAHAQSASIAISLDNGKLLVRVCDDGAGFDPATVAAGNGLANMRRRAEQIGATLSITSAPGSGTSIHLEAPLR